MKKIFLVLLTVLSFVSITAIGQNKNIAQPELDSGTIEQQFDYIITKSSKFKDFQLIRKASILKVKAHALDSIKTVRKDLITANKSIAQIEGSISQLESEVQTLKNEIETISTAVDSISLFGTPLSKSAYNSVVWSIIVVLLLALIVFIAQFKKSNIITKHTKNDLNKIENEFEAFRKKAMKKEQEVMRKLQDEINKNTH
jgi:septal ring factor EnvC (AmiA/AmiB activator)